MNTRLSLEPSTQRLSEPLVAGKALRPNGRTSPGRKTGQQRGPVDKSATALGQKDSEPCTKDSEQSPKHSERCLKDSERWRSTVNTGKGQWTIQEGQWANIKPQWTISEGQWTNQRDFQATEYKGLFPPIFCSIPEIHPYSILFSSIHIDIFDDSRAEKCQNRSQKGVVSKLTIDSPQPYQ